MIRHLNGLVYDINKNSVKVTYQKQTVIYNTFHCKSIHKFNKFRDILATSRSKELEKIEGVFELATKYEVRGTAGAYTLYKTIAY